jgi:2-polyprenyl-3-methyl-5-hydroxy-6-metoxy-1,4-benzoquinol methylase
MKLLKICYNGTSKVKGEKLMTNKYYYNPKIFDIDSIEAAKNIILTKEDTLDTNSRWESETNFLIDSIASFFKLDENMTILDYGCGIGRVSKGLIEKYNCKVIGVDISESMRSQAIDYVNNKNFKAIDPSELKSLINSGFKVDAAISIWVIQHSPKPFEDILLLKNIIK